VLITTHLVAEWNGVAARCLLCRDGAIERELDPSDLPHDFDESEGFALGSARATRAGFGASPKHSLNRAREKFAKAGAPSPAREARALPGGIRS
ncbi:MAG TPA: hypothetical protein VLI42_08440, partial [Chthoniobacterales bacterium]|nr:hypothetical protein [Chthoniobacterales bacterium]